MPELPEVETIARGLREIVGRRIVGVEVRWARSIVEMDPATFAQRLRCKRIRGVGRRGKWLVLSLERNDRLLIHLRMSGRLVLGPAETETDRYTRVILALDDERWLRFSDPRKFGRMVLTTNPDEVLGDLGPEPLEAGFTPQRLEDMLAGRRARLKSLLLNQRFLAGLGNIYADEALWRARLHPLRQPGTLSREEMARLHRAIRQVLTEAIARRGTTLEDRQYVRPDGRPGDFAARLAVYRRTGRPCPRCGALIERIVVSGRGTHFCPQCQQEPTTPPQARGLVPDLERCRT
ncbi:MAG TPA: bifunctional DNA-formamidopyrimidine glycosylase/DNA-(apurinic or apyrimidinic site) lyase [Anaerolineae bacterium]|nr:bifunctional DNA-formamidopyrimidine glycosylase/DNA-(apurinic or apyrimidinic site) lyase [Anaerolineae bacterium]